MVQMIFLWSSTKIPHLFLIRQNINGNACFYKPFSASHRRDILTTTLYGQRHGCCDVFYFCSSQKLWVQIKF